MWTVLCPRGKENMPCHIALSLPSSILLSANTCFILLSAQRTYTFPLQGKQRSLVLSWNPARCTGSLGNVQSSPSVSNVAPCNLANY